MPDRVLVMCPVPLSVNEDEVSHVLTAPKVYAILNLVYALKNAVIPPGGICPPKLSLRTQ